MNNKIDYDDLDYVILSKDREYTVCIYHVTYAFQSESTLYSCLNVWPAWLNG